MSTKKPVLDRKKGESLPRLSILFGLVFLAIVAGILILWVLNGRGNGATTDGSGLPAGPANKTEEVVLAVESLSLNDTRIFTTIRKAGCTTSADHGNYWTIDGCTDSDVYFRIDLSADSAGGGGNDNYLITYCARTSEQGTRFLKLSGLMEKECRTDSDRAILLKDLGSEQVYSVCGWRVTVRGECILGIGGL